VAWAVQQNTSSLRGFEGVVAGDVSIGAGLSSSAAWELAAARAFSAVSSFTWNAAKMALLGQQAENQWVGVNCGIMDQMISAAGKAGHALLIDCRSLETQAVPLPAGTVVVVLDTATRRGLVDSLDFIENKVSLGCAYLCDTQEQSAKIPSFDRSGVA
jgi:galactokinase